MKHLAEPKQNHKTLPITSTQAGLGGYHHPNIEASQLATVPLGGYSFPSTVTLGAQTHHSSSGMDSKTIGMCWPQPHQVALSVAGINNRAPPRCFVRGLYEQVDLGKGEGRRVGRTASGASSFFAHFVCPWRESFETIFRDSRPVVWMNAYLDLTMRLLELGTMSSE